MKKLFSLLLTTVLVFSLFVGFSTSSSSVKAAGEDLLVGKTLKFRQIEDGSGSRYKVGDSFKGITLNADSIKITFTDTTNYTVTCDTAIYAEGTFSGTYNLEDGFGQIKQFMLFDEHTLSLQASTEPNGRYDVSAHSPADGYHINFEIPGTTNNEDNNNNSDSNVKDNSSDAIEESSKATSTSDTAPAETTVKASATKAVKTGDASFAVVIFLMIGFGIVTIYSRKREM